ncbi:MAG: AAA domain-containing protein, partial [Planctomycetaceae bacterium]
MELLTEYLLREFRMQFRDAATRVKRPLVERLEEGNAIGGMRVVRHGSDGATQRTVFETDSVSSWFRAGDYYYCHPEEEEIDLDVAMQAQGRKQILDITADRRTITLPGHYDRDRTWCIDKLPTERFPLTTYPCLLAGAMESACATGDKVRRWLTAGVAPASDGLSRRGSRKLTRTQRQALQRALHDEIVLIQGPPGSGKTFLIAEIINQLMRDNDQTRILLCCFSHAAIDNGLQAIQACNPGIPLNRVGRRDEDPPLPPGTIEAGNQIPDSISPGVWGMTAFKAAVWWTRPLSRAYKSVLPQSPSDADCLTAVRQAWQQAPLPDVEDYFDVVIIDEASQMTVPTALMPMVNANRCILVGDEKQLPPVSQSTPRFAPSIFDHMIDQYTDDRPVMLDVTHRMNADICATPSKLFYGGKLHSDAAIRDRRLTYPEAPATFEEEPAWLGRVMDPQEPVLFVNVEHDTGDESSPEEATVIARIVAGMLATGLTHDEGIAVICAHRKQNNLVRRYTEQAVRKTFPHDDIDVENLVSDT